jgi:glycosyltransferase, group 1 family
MKTNILVECPELISSVKIGVLDLLENREECNIEFKRTSTITKHDILWSDVVISVRGCEKASLKIMESANRAGRYTIMFLDDDLINIPLNLDSTKYYNDKKLKKYILEILANCQILWAVNPRIIEKYSKYTIKKNGVLGKVPMKIEIEKKEWTEPVKVLYAGSIDHKQTLQKIISPVITKFDEIINKKIMFTFIGANPEIEKTKHYNYFQDYESYKKFVIEGKFDIGLAPIETTEFYKSKYYNKFLEYTSIGVVGIYTDTEPYNLIIKDGINGFLCENNPEKWYLKIKKIIENPSKIAEILENAQRQVREDYNINVVSNEILTLIPELIEYKAKEKNIKNIRLENIKLIFYMERIQLLMRIYGLKSIIVIPYKILKKIIKKVIGRK